MGVMGKRSSLTTSDFVEFAEDFVDSPEEKISKVLHAVDRFMPLCETYRVDKDIAEKIKSVIDGLIVDDKGLRKIIHS